MSNAKYAALAYSRSMNLGDEIQSAAAQDLLVRLDRQPTAFVDRDTGECAQEGRIRCVYNGWFDGQYCSFPPLERVEPLFVGFHLNEVRKNETYRWLEPHLRPGASLLDHEAYFRRYQPIGCRDAHTEAAFRSRGVETGASGCLTMTLQNGRAGPRNGRYLVDLKPEDYELLPRELWSAPYLSHAWSGSLTDVGAKMKEARRLLDVYRTAELVVTRRLHCLLPCLAFDTPVVFFPEKDDVRYPGLTDGCLTADKVDDWTRVPVVRPIGWHDRVARMTDAVREWIARE